MPLTPDTFANVATSTVQGGAGGAGTPLNAGDTACLLLAGGGTPFPTIGPSRMLLGPVAGAHVFAIITANTSVFLSLLPPQGGTTAQSKAAAPAVQLGAAGGRPCLLWE